MDAAAGLDGEVAPDVRGGAEAELLDAPASRLETVIRILGGHPHGHDVTCSADPKP